MKNYLKMFAMFVVGAAAGSSAAYVLTKKHYETFIESEINSAKEAYEKMQKDLYEKNNVEKERLWNEYFQKGVQVGVAEQLGYVGPTNEEVPAPAVAADADIPEEYETNPTYVEAPAPFVGEPDQDIYMINQESVGGLHDEYEIEDLTYYSNGVFTNSLDEQINDADDLLGKTMLDLIAQYEDSSLSVVCIRNDKLMKDFVIDFAGYDFQEA